MQQTPRQQTRRVHPTRRKASVGDIELTERDLKLFFVLHQNRCAFAHDLFSIIRPGEPRYRDRNGKQLASTPYKKFSHRLRRLFEHTFIDRLAVPEPWSAAGRRETYAYALGDKGAQALMASDNSITIAGKRTQSNRKLVESAKSGSPYLRHELKATSLLATLTRVLSRDSFIWFGEHEWRDYAKDPKVWITWNSQSKNQGIYPDRGLILSLPEGRGHRCFMIEVDNATEPGARKSLKSGTSLFQKYLAYHAWWREKSHRKHGLSNFIVLTITTTDDRARNLREHARSVDPHGGSHLFWSTSFDQFENDPRKILDPICLSAGDPADSDARHALFESSTHTRSASLAPRLVVK